MERLVMRTFMMVSHVVERVIEVKGVHIVSGEIPLQIYHAEEGLFNRRTITSSTEVSVQKSQQAQELFSSFLRSLLISFWMGGAGSKRVFSAVSNDGAGLPGYCSSFSAARYPITLFDILETIRRRINQSENRRVCCGLIPFLAVFDEVRGRSVLW